jgi:hypothetical protein
LFQTRKIQATELSLLLVISLIIDCPRDDARPYPASAPSTPAGVTSGQSCISGAFNHVSQLNHSCIPQGNMKTSKQKEKEKNKVIDRDADVCR